MEWWLRKGWTGMVKDKFWRGGDKLRDDKIGEEGTRELGRKEEERIG